MSASIIYFLNVNMNTVKGEIKWSRLHQGVFKWSQEATKEVSLWHIPHRTEPLTF